MDRMVRGRPRRRGCAGRGVAVSQQVTVPAQDGVRAYQQREVSELVGRQVVEQPGEHEAVAGCEHGVGHLALQDRQLMPQHQNLDFLVAVVSWQGGFVTVR
jgi:hypothetical protein